MKRKYILIGGFILIILVGSYLFFYNQKIINLELIVPLQIEYYISFLSIFSGLFIGLYKWLDLKDLQEEKEKHLGYIRTINDRVGNKIDGNFFTDMYKARKFCEKEEYYIVPYGYKYNVSSIDNENIVDSEKNETLLEIIIGKIKGNFNYNILEEELKDYKEFIDLEYFVERLSSNNINSFDIKDKIVNDIFINKKCFDENKDKIINLLNNGNDFILIEGYYYLYKI